MASSVRLPGSAHIGRPRFETAVRLRLGTGPPIDRQQRNLRGADEPRLPQATQPTPLLIGPNGVGKSTLARNLAHEAVIHGHTVLFTTAGQLLGELAALDSDAALRRRLRHYVAPTLLVIDEVGYLSYSNRHADLMFELISRRYEQKSTVVTTNRAFADWREIFPNAACVVSMVDRLMHNAEVVSIEGDSYRAKEAKERAERKGKQRRGGKS